MKKDRKKSMVIILSVLKASGILLLLYIVTAFFMCAGYAEKGYEKLGSYNTRTLELSYGKISFTDEGEGETILVSHGIFGGYDQGYETSRNFIPYCRVISPSRFGYPGSSVKGDGTPREQAEAFSELTDDLGISKIFILGTSAGGTPALEFALMYPEKVNGLILYSADLPPESPPETKSAYEGPPPFLISNFPMYLLSPLFPGIMGLPRDTIYSMLPVEPRKEGIINDGLNVNTAYYKDTENYRLENLKVPVLIIHSKDDSLVDYENVLKNSGRIPSLRFITIEKGGHMMEGSSDIIEKSVLEFIEANR